MKLNFNFLFKISCCALLMLGSAGNLFSQISGLAFNSYSVTKDLRTGLDLFPEKPMNVKDNFDLSFNFRLRTGETMYFGYVFRMITGNNNIDLLFNYDGIDVTYFTLVQGQKLLARVNSDFNDLCSEWKEFRFGFDINNGSVTIRILDTLITVSDTEIGRDKKLSLYFGHCNVGEFKTTDVPAMNLRDISIIESDRIVHHWPLDEMSGNVGKDDRGRSNAVVINPEWLKSEHYNWQEVYNSESAGYAWCAFDSKREEVIIIKPAELIKFSLNNNQATTYVPKNSNANLFGSRQALYDANVDKVYILDVDKPSVSSFDFSTLMWSGDLDAGAEESDFSHYNKFSSGIDTSVYFIGGYGHHRYKNLVQKFNIETGEMKTINTSGDFFSPRYLAALGELNDTVYIIGGFGSTSGEQILNPHSYFDLMALSLKDHSFHKKFEITPKPEDHAFSNSMIIDTVDRSFYALTFPIFSYNGYLQLIKGSLDSPGYSLLGSRIPYQFLDIVSFSDLYISRKNNKLVTVTIKNEGGKSLQKIFTLSYPPDEQSDSIIPAVKNSRLKKILIAGIVFVSLVFFIILLLRRRKKPEEGSVGEAPDIIPPRAVPASEKLNFCYLHFFGDFQVINVKGEDITRKFTPLLKELFLLIWLNSIKNDIGVSNEKIIEILWHGFPDSSAQNNKAVNIAKLRAILSENLNCSLSYKNTGYWRIEFKNRKIVNDYYEFIMITSIKTNLSCTDISKLVEFSQKGQFLANLKYSWLEEYKVSVSNEMISRFIKYLRSLNIKEEPDQVIRISEAILRCDNLNEEAMGHMCKGLITLGRHTVAKEVYDQFVREYKILYNVEYEKTFASIASQL